MTLFRIGFLLGLAVSAISFGTQLAGRITLAEATYGVSVGCALMVLAVGGAVLTRNK